MFACSMNEAWTYLSEESTKSEVNTPFSGSSGIVIESDKAKEALDVLQQNNFLHVFWDWFLEKYHSFLVQELMPSFWSALPREELPEAICNYAKMSSISSATYFRLFNAVDNLHDESRRWIENPILRLSFGESPSSGLKFLECQQQMVKVLKALILSKIPLHFSNYLLLTYCNCFRISRHLRFRVKRRVDQDMSEPEEEEDMDPEYSNVNEEGCPICGKTIDTECDELVEETDPTEGEGLQELELQEHSPVSCNCQVILDCFDKMNHQLREMDLLEVIADDAVASVVNSHIEKHIKVRCQGNFEISCIERLENWVRVTVIGWLQLVYGDGNNQVLKSTEERLMHYMYEIYASIRIEKMFDIIIEFPESVAAVEDLKICLEKCNGFRAKVISSLKYSFEARLLHPGVATNDILTAYIQAIKALRILDPTGVILQLVCDPIKNYLKSKDDTVRCIITALTDENSDLIPELVSSVPQPGEENVNQSDDENVAKNWQTWKPDPIDAAQAPKSSKSMRSSDIVSILVNVYESKDLFVEEYQRLLAQRFLANFDCNVEFERRNLELLTLKFGEADLHACEVMLQDMTSSKRIDMRINAGEISAFHFKEFNINCLILSAQFWPEKLGLPNCDEASNLKLPPPVSEAVDSYTKAFETIKGSRTLHWKPHLGSVEVKLDFNDRQLCFSVSPIQASLIWHFQDKQSWRISELSHVLAVPTSVVRRKITFWQNKGILKEVKTDKYVLIEDQSAQSAAASDNQTMSVDQEYDDYEDHADDRGASAAAKHNTGDEKFRMFWSFIENMLTNLNSLPLERIHTMLQMFALQGSNANELSIHELRVFLEAKVKEQLLVYSGGQYRLASYQ